MKFVNEVLTSAGTFIKQGTSGRKTPSCRVGWRAAASKAAEAESLLKLRWEPIKNRPNETKLKKQKEKTPQLAVARPLFLMEKKLHYIKL